MSSNIKIQRICKHCNNEFTARTTVTQYCSDACSKRAYKLRLREGKVEASNKETQLLKVKPIEEIKAKEFLTVRDVSKLLSCSLRTAYRLIEQGNIKAVNIAQRKTLVKRSDIDKLFEQSQSIVPQIETPVSLTEYEISDCYNLAEVQSKYGIAERTLHELIRRNSIPKIKKGWYSYVPKSIVDKLLS